LGGSDHPITKGVVKGFLKASCLGKGGKASTIDPEDRVHPWRDPQGVKALQGTHAGVKLLGVRVSARSPRLSLVGGIVQGLKCCNSRLQILDVFLWQEVLHPVIVEPRLGKE
jgi:hypothetical protein